MSALDITIEWHYYSPSFEQEDDNPEVNLSEQSVKECNSSLLLTMDSHH